MSKIIIYQFYNLGKIFGDKRYKTTKALDATISFLRNKAVSQQEKQAARSKRISGIAYLGLNKAGDVRFACKSEDGSKIYIQAIRFYDLNKLRPKSRDDILKMMRESDVGVYSNDPSFLYWGGAYNATVGGYNIVVENRPPKGGPHKSAKMLAEQKKFVLSKHLLAVLRAVPFYWNTMVKDLVAYFKIIEDQEQRDLDRQNRNKPVTEEEMKPEENKTKVVGTKNATPKETEE